VYAVSYKRLVETVSAYEPDEDLQWIIGRITNSKRVIVFGTGRSGDVADAFAKFLRNIGVDQTFGPNDVPYIFGPCDLLVAISGSGSTQYTLEVAKVAKEGGSFIISLTSDQASPLAAISDKIILIPGARKWKGSDYFVDSLLGTSKAPLTPLGTLFELRSLLFLLSVISYIRGQELIESYRKLVSLIKEFEPPSDYYELLYEILPKASEYAKQKTTVLGEGLSGIVGRFFSTRLRHLSKGNAERLVYFWLDKGSIAVRRDDLVFIISGSASEFFANLAEKAKTKGAKVAVVTSFQDSRLSKVSDLTLAIPGRQIVKLKGLRSSYFPQDPTYSVFELRTLFFLESFIHYVAEKENISETDMKMMHSDFT
jgi:D-arabinose 5-phosphate isomerase GutQ